jgi:hypothetical protein
MCTSTDIPNRTLSPSRTCLLRTEVSGSNIMAGARYSICIPNQYPSVLEVREQCITHTARSHVTHIVASQMPHSKIQKNLNAANPKTIVKPDWVVACVEAGTFSSVAVIVHK